MGFVGKFLIWLSGAHRDILDSCRTDRAKYVGVGSAVLVTSVMAAISMAFALHIALKAPLPAAIPFALAWGLAIMSLDRWLVVSMSRRQLWLALPRVLLGLLFGVIISTPLTLQIFHVEIDNQIALDQTQAASDFQASLKHNALYLKVIADEKAVAADQAVIDSGGGTGTSPASDPVLVSLNSQLKSDQAQANNYYDLWHCEKYGFPGHCAVGNGPAAATNWQNYQTYSQRVQSDQDQISAERKSLDTKNSSDATQAVVTARANLKTDQATLRLDKDALTAREDSFNSSNAANSGILASLRALEELRSSDATLFWAEFLLFLFFTSIECLPIGVKVLLNLGPMNAYEVAVAEAEDAGKVRAREELLKQHLMTVRDRDRIYEEADLAHSQWQASVLPHLVAERVAARERIEREWLRGWEARARARRNLDMSDDFFGLGGPPGTDWMAAGRSRGSRPEGRRARDDSGAAPATKRMRRRRFADAWQALRSTEPPAGPAPMYAASMYAASMYAAPVYGDPGYADRGYDGAGDGGPGYGGAPGMYYGPTRPQFDMPTQDVQASLRGAGVYNGPVPGGPARNGMYNAVAPTSPQGFPRIG